MNTVNFFQATLLHCTMYKVCAPAPESGGRPCQNARNSMKKQTKGASCQARDETMEHDNEALAGRAIAPAETASDAAGLRAAMTIPWVLVHCGPYGVRPRRAGGRFASGGQARAR